MLSFASKSIDAILNSFRIRLRTRTHSRGCIRAFIKRYSIIVALIFILILVSLITTIKVDFFDIIFIFFALQFSL